MKAIPGLILYHQVYHKKHGDEVAYCPDCKEYHEEYHELLVDTVDDEVNFSFCNECEGTFHRDNILWKEAEKDSENNAPEDAHKYHALFVIQQGGGHWTNIKYRTFLDGTVQEYDKLQRLIRELKPLTADTLIKILNP